MGSPTADRRRRRAGWSIVGLIGFAILTGPLWSRRVRHVENSTHLNTLDVSGANLPVRADLDLRQRPANATGARSRPALPRRRIHLEVHLPPESQAGPYEIQLVGSEATPVATASGSATRRKDVLAVQTTLELTQIAPGAYQFRLRRAGNDWHSLPITVQ